MGLGLLGVEYESIVLPYDDEATPIKLTGQKMLPILEISDGNAINESLIILKKFDPKDILNWSQLFKSNIEIDELINKIGSPVHSLCMPYWIWTPEFDPNSRKYFQQKKEIKRGPFKKLIQNKGIYLLELDKILTNEIEVNLGPFYKSSSLSIIDIMIASHLWGMYIFPEFQFSATIHNYLQRIKSVTHFDYHKDFWR